MFILKNKKGFTLSEVLITMTIIGVVAALTIPTLNAHHQKVEYSTKLKKIYNVMNAAVSNAERDFNLPASKWANLNVSSEEYFNAYLKDYLLASYSLKNQGATQNGYRIYLNDGTSVEFLTYALSMVYTACKDECLQNLGDSPTNELRCVAQCNAGGKSCTGVIYDLNGDKGPNEHGRDLQRFYICGEGWQAGQDGFDVAPNEQFSSSNPTRNDILAECKSEPQYGACTKLLKIDGWQFKDDYPYRVQ